MKWTLTLMMPTVTDGERAVLRVVFEDNVAVALLLLGPGAAETRLVPEPRSLDEVREEMRATARKLGGHVVERGGDE